MLQNIDFWSALSGLVGSVLIFFFGLPPKLDPDGHIHLITEQVDEQEKVKAGYYKKLGNLGILLVGLSFVLQILKIIYKL
ncbi:MAG TPA: hypothetical protein VGQ87_02970 [Patescibacteria group bacterium]|jgi:hypothetical protein|nr:hypothetical protein [Patescibacteria group bacterium]